MSDDFQFFKAYREEIFKTRDKITKLDGVDEVDLQKLIPGRWYQRIDEDNPRKTDFVGQFVEKKGNNDYVFYIIPPSRFSLGGHPRDSILLQFTLPITDEDIAMTSFYFEEIAPQSNGQIMLMPYQENALEAQATSHWNAHKQPGGRRTNKNFKKEVRKRKSRKRKSRKPKKLRRKKTTRCSLDKYK